MKNFKVLDKIEKYEDFKSLETEDLFPLAEDLRKYIIEIVSKNGGHLASNLGVIELAIALLYKFNLPKDKIIWDVGHQSYIHKILTDRKEAFKTLRQYKGISGFPKREESIFDVFGTGHSSTSISAGIGIATARDLKEDNFKVISVIGDGSLTAGIALEALNYAGSVDKDFIVIVNDNEFSISKNVGALSSYLNRILTGKIITRLREDIKKTLQLIPGSVGESLRKFVKHTEVTLKGFVIPPGIIFEELGYQYVGPVDGHNLELLLETFDNIKDLNKPILLHVNTVKGKGYEPAENSPTKFHGIGQFKIETGLSIKKSTTPSYTDIFSRTIIKLAEKDDKIVAITAAMPSGTGLEKFSEIYPDRFFDVGISEQHGVTFAAGLATEGFKPVVAIYSTFLQRAFDMLIHDVALQKLPVIFAMDRAGIVGEDGPTHHGLFDISYLRCIPNFIIMAPKDENELQHMLFTATKLKNPVAIRYPRGAGTGVELDKEFRELEVGKFELIKDGSELMVISVGHVFKEVSEAVKDFDDKVGLINLRFIKPLDEKLKDIFLKYRKIVVIEENVISGGAGSGILEFAALSGFSNFECFKLIGINDSFVEHGNQKLLKDKYGLSSEKIKKAIEGVLYGGSKD
jgi:1-deoxy-D-xylulose-5-phosphate synthase